MDTGSRVRRGGDADGQLWMRRVTARVSAALAEGDDQIRRLRRRGYQIAALDRDLVATHNRRYSLRLPFGLSRAFVGPRDYRGRAFGVRPGNVATTSVRLAV